MKRRKATKEESNSQTTQSPLRRAIWKIPIGLVIFYAALIIYAVTLNGVWATDHPTSFLELDWAIWSRHTFILGNVGTFQPHTVDDFQYNGHYYSALAPGTAILSLPFVVVGFLLEGGFTVYGNVMVLSELFVAITNAVATYLVYKMGTLYFKPRTSVFLAFAYAFSTISWPFATYYFQSDVSALFDLLAAFIAIKISRSEKSGFKSAFLCGLAIAAAITVDYVNAILVPVILGFLIYTKRNQRAFPRVTLAFLSASILGAVFIGLYNLSSFGRVFVSSEQLYLSSSTLLGQFGFPMYLGVILNLVTPLRGLFLFSPLLVLGVAGMQRMLGSSTYDKEALLMLSIFLGILLPYSSWYGPTGGAAFGPRFIIPAIPFLLLPVGFLIESRRERLMYWTAYGLFAFGVLINGIGGLTSALAPQQEWLSSPFLDSALPNFLRGSLDVWWIGSARSYWIVPSVLIIFSALILPFLVGLAAKKTASKVSTGS